MGAYYAAALGRLKGLQLPLAETPYARNIYWVYGLVLEDHVDFDAEVAMARLAEAGVGIQAIFWPMHEQPVFRNRGLFAGERYPVAERLARRGFYLPSGLALTEVQMCTVVDAVNRMMA